MKLAGLFLILNCCLWPVSLDAATAVPTVSTVATQGVGDFPIWIELDKPQLVTVVIEDAHRVRVRNLIAETQLTAGRNRLSWDGYDDGKQNAAGDLVRTRVAPGTYRARGLTQDGIQLVYEFTAYSGGNPPWPTKDHTGGWLADHYCPLGAVFLPAKSGSPYGDGAPQVLLTSYVAEAGAPLVWVGLDGQTLQRRHVWGWDGAVAATRDAGTSAQPDLYAFLALAKEKDIHIRALKSDGTGINVLSFKPKNPDKNSSHSGHSLAVHDGLLAFSVVSDEAVAFADVATKKIIDVLPMPKPTGLHFDPTGRLLVISNGKVLRYTVKRETDKTGAKKVALADESVVIASGLDEPRTLAFNPAGTELYVSSWGKSHQVKVFTPDGKPLRTIGKPNDGGQLGLYDELKMQAPLGLAIDDRDQLWVVEATHLPKRISLWDAKTGAFQRAHYGPPHYGGGGTIDPSDKTRLFYSDHVGLIEFALDWKTGTAKPHAICVNGWSGGTSLVEKYGIEYDPAGPSRWGFVSERPTKINGRTYITGSWSPGHRSNGHTAIWMLDENRVAWPVARIGGTGFAWPPQQNQNFETARAKAGKGKQELVAWSDLNGNHKVDADEYTIRNMPGTYTDAEGKTKDVYGFVSECVFPDLSMTANWGLHVPAPTINDKGIPIWDLSKAEFILPADPMFFFDEQFNWGRTVWPLADGWVVAGFSGFRDRKQMWSYPVGGDTVPTLGGDIRYPTRALGPPMKAPTGEAGYYWAMNGEKGNIFLMTSDGLFLQTLGGDMRNTPLIRLPKAERGMVIDAPGKHVSFEDEHFCPTWTQTDRGEIYLVAGKEHSSIFRVDGFASVKRRDFAKVVLDVATLAALPEQLIIPVRKQAAQVLQVEVGTPESTVDGKLDDYTTWVSLGSGSAKQASVHIGAKHLYAAWRTGDPACLVNAGGDDKFLFKRGGCVDLMIQTGTETKREGKDPIAGDLRLLITTVKGQTKAMLYRALVPGTAEKDRTLFESPVGSVWFDSVVEVSKQVKLAQLGGDVEISIPLEVLGLKPTLGGEISADIGLLRGDTAQTIQRLYWNNLDTLIVSDIPSEARLQPRNWGIWKFIAPAPTKVIAAVSPGAVEPGLAYGYHQIAAKKLPDFSALKPTSVAVAAAPRLQGLGALGPAYALDFTGFVRVPAEGVWKFTTNSDGGSRLWIGDALIVDNDGVHGPQNASGLVRLAVGLHPIRIGYCKNGPGQGLRVSWSGPGLDDQEIAPDMFFRKP